MKIKNIALILFALPILHCAKLQKDVFDKANPTASADNSAPPTYTIIYMGNENTSGIVPVDFNNYSRGNQAEILSNMGALAKDGSVFTGWNTAPNGSGTTYHPAATAFIGNANLILYARWSMGTTYTITYNGNTNNSGIVPVDQNLYVSGDKATVLPNTGNLTKAGYTFVGWNTLADGSGTTYANSSEISVNGANITLYARWTSGSSYNITYHGNGNLTGSVPTDTQNYLAGDLVILPYAGNIQKPGYTFAGWNTAADGSGTTYQPGTNMNMPVSNLTLYSRWISSPVYTFTYNGNGNTSGDVPVDAKNYTAYDAWVPLFPGTLVKTGYTFIGWASEPNPTFPHYMQPGQEILFGSSAQVPFNYNFNLYAIWSDLPTYTITYNGNGYTSGNPPVDHANYTGTAFFKVKKNSGNLVKTGNNFAGWNSAANGTGTQYYLPIYWGSLDLIYHAVNNTNLTLYAHWTTQPVYTITYNGNGQTAGQPPTDPNLYLQGKTVIVPAVSSAAYAGFQKNGLHLIGWNTTADGTGTRYTSSNPITIGTTNLILYAEWVNATYNVTYNGNGSNGGLTPTDYNIYGGGEQVTVHVNYGSLTKTGYTFAGWNTAANGSGASYAPSATFTMPAGNITLYAVWNAVASTYTVTYNGNGNTGGSAPVDSTSYIAGATVTVSNNTGSLTKTGYTFAGWNTAANGSGTSYSPTNTFSMPAGNITLYAVWNAVASTYTVTYNGNGNTGGSAPVDSNNYTAGATVTASNNTGSLTKTGYTFAGWNTAANGSGTSYAPSATFTMPAGNITLYAVWNAVASTCRNYMTSYTTGGNTYTCTWNNSIKQYSCTGAGNTYLYYYSSTNDFVDEALTVGRYLMTSMNLSGSSSSTIGYSYDGSKRLTTQTLSAAGYTFTYTYTAWDVKGRPTTGSYNWAYCSNAVVSMSYNDATRTRTDSISGGSGLGCAASNSTLTYDANGNGIQSVASPGGTTTYTINTTGQQCY